MNTSSSRLAQSMIAVGMLAVSFCAASASDNGVPADARKFHAMIGHWKGNGILSGGEQPMKLALAYRCDAAAAGWGIACVMEGDGEGMAIRENDLMGVDPVTGKSHWYAVTNMGETHDHELTWTSDRSFKAQYVWQQDGARMEENILVSFPDARTMEFRSVVSANGRDVGSFVGKLKR